MSQSYSPQATSDMSSSAMSVQSSTPLDVAIHRRDRKHDLAASLSREWMNNNVFATAWFNAMSITFPLGEQFFIESVRHFRDDISDPKLKQEVMNFFSQEGVHRREHQRYNELLCEQRGYDLDALERTARRRQKWIRKNVPAIEQLAGTVAMEHITAVLAEKILDDDQFMQGVDPAMAKLWLWHAAEEMEHKAVAFDVFCAVGGTEKMRKAALRRGTLLLALDIFRNLRHMLRADGKLWSAGVWLQGFRFLFAEGGLLRDRRPAYSEFFQDGFHPWQQDNSALLEKWKLQQQ